MITSPETKNILKALAALKKDLLPVTKGENNPFFKSKYADLNTHLDAVEPLAETNGLILTQATTSELNGANAVETRLTHVVSGEFVAAKLFLVLAKQDMQNMGSAVTYARRYTLGSLLGMKAVDDDGNSATFGNEKKTVISSSTKEGPTTKPVSSFRKKKTEPAANNSVADPVSETTDESTWE